MIEVVIGEMVGSDQVPDRKITSEPLGGESDLPTRAKWRALPREQRGALKKMLTPPTLLERGFIASQGQRAAEAYIYSCHDFCTYQTHCLE
jgi:hypothetical protein